MPDQGCGVTSRDGECNPDVVDILGEVSNHVLVSPSGFVTKQKAFVFSNEAKRLDKFSPHILIKKSRYAPRANNIVSLVRRGDELTSVPRDTSISSKNAMLTVQNRTSMKNHTCTTPESI